MELAFGRENPFPRRALSTAIPNLINLNGFQRNCVGDKFHDIIERHLRIGSAS